MAGAAPSRTRLRSVESRQVRNLQFAFFNGIGWESWRNLGYLDGITPRDAEAARRVRTIERAVARFW